jgi:hypothetical protein
VTIIRIAGHRDNGRRPTMESAGPRLMDEFRAEAVAGGVEIPGELSRDVRGSDLRRPSIESDLRGLFDPSEPDSPYEVRGYSRCMVFQRRFGTIHYHAAPILAGAPPWWETGEDPARVAAVEAENEEDGEHGTLASVADAVALAAAYLGGAPLEEISVPRQKLRIQGVRIMCAECGYRTPEELAFVESIRRKSGPALLDELRGELAARGLQIPGEVEICGGFADFGFWPREYELEEVVVREHLDPAFKVVGYSRYVVLARIAGEIRCYAAPIPPPMAVPWYRSDPARMAAMEAEVERRWLGMLTSVADAVTLTCAYLGGASIEEIAVTRLPQPWYG